MYSNNTARKSSEYFVYGVIALQTVFAIWWSIKSGTSFVAEKMSSDYLQAAETMQCDDYMGILYALILRVLIKTVGEGGLFAVLIRILQLGAVFGAALLLPVSRKAGILTGLYMVTCPFVLQTSFEILPNAFELAAGVAALGICWTLWNCFSIKKTLILFAAVIILAFLNPDTVWISAAVLIPYGIIIALKKAKKTGLGILLATVLVLAVCFFANRAVLKPYTYNRACKTVSLLSFQRFVWPYMGDVAYGYYDYTGENGVELIQSASEYPEGVIEEFGYVLEEKMGLDAAKVFYRYWAKAVPSYGRKRIVIPIVQDMAFYCFPMAGVSAVYFMKIEDSVTAWNVSGFVHAGGIARIFFAFFLASAMIICFAEILTLFRNNKTVIERKIKLFAFYIVVVVAIYGTFFAVRGFDYRRCLLAAMVCQALFISELFEKQK